MKQNGKIIKETQLECNRQYGFIGEGYNPILDSYIPGLSKEDDKKLESRSKICRACEERKPLTDYYKKKVVARWDSKKGENIEDYQYYDTICKECFKKQTAANARKRRQGLKP